MKKLLILFSALLSGCAGFVPYVQQHAAGIAAISAVAGAVATTENAVINTITLGEKLRRDEAQSK